MSKNGTSQTGSSQIFHFTAGLFSGISSAVILQPVDLLKTRVQQSGTSALGPTLRNIFQGPSPAKQLWRGTLPSTLRTGVGSALYFSTLNKLRSLAAGAPDKLAHDAQVQRSSSAVSKLSNTANLVTGGLARGGVGFIMMPITVIKVRYESNFYAYGSIFGAGRDIFRREGFRGFFSGFGATALRDTPYAGIYVLFYEQSKKRLNSAFFAERTTPSSAASSVPINFTSGALAAALATAVTNPFDAVKTRLQLFPETYGNMARAVKMMIRNEGFRSLMDGLALRVGRKAFSSALTWTLYEEVIRRSEQRLVAATN